MEIVDRRFAFGIRRYQLEDIPALFVAVRESKRELGRWLSWCHANYSIADARAWVESRDAAWEKGEAYSFVVFDRKTKALVGGVGLNRIDHLHKVANLGYWIRTRETRRGAATAATILAARFGIEKLGLNRIEILVAVENIASHRVAEKVGAKREGYLRRRLLLQGKSHDAIIYSLIAEDLGLRPGGKA